MKVEVAVLGLISLMVSADIKHHERRKERKEKKLSLSWFFSCYTVNE